MTNTLISKIILKKSIVGLLIIGGLFFLFNNLVGLFLSVALPVPDAIDLRLNSYNKLLSKLDRLELDGSMTLAKGSYKIAVKDFKNVEVRFDEDTKISAHIIGEINSEYLEGNKIRIKPEFKEFNICFSSPVSISGAGIDIAKLHGLRNSEKITGDFSIHFANIIGYGLTSYIFQKEQISKRNDNKFSREMIKSFSIHELTGKFNPNSKLSTSSGVFLIERDLMINISDVELNGDNDVLGNIKIVSDSIKPPSIEIEGRVFSLGSLSIKYNSSFKYTNQGIELSNDKNGIFISTTNVNINNPSSDNNMSILEVEFVGNESKFLLDSSSELLNYEFIGGLHAHEIEYTHKDTKTALDLSTKECINISFHINNKDEATSYMVSSNNDINAVLNNFVNREKAGISFEHSSIKIPPFSVSSLRDINIDIEQIDIQAGKITIGEGHQKNISLLPEGPLHIKFNKPLVISPFKDKLQYTQIFDIDGKIKQISITDGAGRQLELSYVEIKASSDGSNLNGQLSLTASGSRIGNATLSEIVCKSTVSIDKLDFNYDGEAFIINRFPVKIYLPESIILDMARREIGKPKKPNYGKIPGRDFGRIFSLGTVRDYRSKTQVYGVSLNDAVFNGHTAKINVSGAFRVELEAEVLKTRSKMCWTKGFKPCMKWGEKRILGKTIKYKYPSTCSKKWKTECPETYHDWTNAASATIKASAAGSIDLDLPKNQKLLDVVLKPKAKVLSVDIKDVPGWLDKNFLTPMVYLFIPNLELGEVKLFKSIPESTRKILDRFVVNQLSIVTGGGSIVVNVNMSGKI